MRDVSFEIRRIFLEGQILQANGLQRHFEGSGWDHGMADLMGQCRGVFERALVEHIRRKIGK